MLNSSSVSATPRPPVLNTGSMINRSRSEISRRIDRPRRSSWKYWWTVSARLIARRSARGYGAAARRPASSVPREGWSGQLAARRRGGLVRAKLLRGVLHERVVHDLRDVDRLGQHAVAHEVALHLVVAVQAERA